MGTYVNPRPDRFEQSINSQIYVDKTGLIAKTNALLKSEDKFLCISRPRRFGKSMGLGMLAAYYAFGQDSRPLFEGLQIAGDPSFEKHLNAYDVIQLNMQEFLTASGHDVDKLIALLKGYLTRELASGNRDATYYDENNFFQVMKDTFNHTGRPFVILIDEWDCLFREFKEETEAQKTYLGFLRAWMKDQPYVALAYMTGILPVKKYGTHSALNMFAEYSMTNPGELAPFFGFTEDEVKALCGEYGASFDEARDWYDGYELCDMDWGRVRKRWSIYGPLSLVSAMRNRDFASYWNRTETYEALKVYIEYNMEGLKDDVICMMAGGELPLDVSSFQNDMTTFLRKDDVMTLLVHLGYLSYDQEAKTVRIPNKEVSLEYATSVAVSTLFSEVARSIEASKRLLAALWEGDESAVAAGLEQAHEEISILSYNNEESLVCAIGLAFYYSREYYLQVREFPTGKGFADVCWIPKRLHADKPACVVELKVDGSAGGSIEQVHERNYPAALREWAGRGGGELLLCSINHDRASKRHTCEIERMSFA